MLWVGLALLALIIGVGCWFGRRELAAHPIRAFALLCVAVTSGYVMWMGYRLNEVLASPGWCGTAIGADRADKDSKVQVASSCVDLLTIQLKSLATNSHILLGVVAVSLLVLVVIVLAGARLSGKWAGGELDMEPAAAARAAADKVAGAAVDTAKEVKAEVAQPDHPDYNGPAMPPPPPKGG